MSAPVAVQGALPLVSDQPVVAVSSSDLAPSNKVNWHSMFIKLALILTGGFLIGRFRAFVPSRLLRILGSLAMLCIVIILIITARLVPTGMLLRFVQRLC